MKRYGAAVLSSLLIFASSVNAGSSSGLVTLVMAHVGDVIIFSAGPHQNKPACSTAGEDWAFSLSTQTGKAMYALILSAQAQGKQINVMGTNTCPAWGDREAPAYVYITQ